MEILIFFTAWTIAMAYVVVGNYLYFAKVLPALSRDGLDGDGGVVRRSRGRYLGVLSDHDVVRRQLLIRLVQRKARGLRSGCRR